MKYVFKIFLWKLSNNLFIYQTLFSIKNKKKYFNYFHFAVWESSGNIYSHVSFVENKVLSEMLIYL